MLPSGSRLLVTGACGQIGTDLVRAVAASLGPASVVATDARPAPPSPLPSGVAYEPLDVTDTEAVHRAVDRHAPTHIVHLAAMLSATGEKNPAAALRVNAGGTTAVLAAATAARAAVFAPSTIAVYGRAAPRHGCGDDAPQFPSTMYGVTKSFQELVGGYAAQRGDVDYRSLRLPGVVSADAPPGGGTTDYAIAMLEAALTTGGPGVAPSYECYLSPDAALPFAYMPDVVDGIVRLMAAPASSLTRRTYSVQGSSFSPADLAAAVRAHVPSFSVSYAPDFRDGIARSWPASLDDAHARADWGWAPSGGVAEMVADMLARVDAKLRAEGKGAAAAATSATADASPLERMAAEGRAWAPPPPQGGAGGVPLAAATAGGP